MNNNTSTISSASSSDAKLGFNLLEAVSRSSRSNRALIDRFFDHGFWDSSDFLAIIKENSTIAGRLQRASFDSMQDHQFFTTLYRDFDGSISDHVKNFVEAVKNTSEYQQYLQSASYILRANKINTVGEWIEFCTNSNNYIHPVVAAKINEAIERFFRNSRPSASSHDLASWQDIVRHLFYQLVKRRLIDQKRKSLLIS
jgi:hypothetical protein